MVNKIDLEALKTSLFRFSGKDPVSGMTFVFQQTPAPELVIVDKQADSIRTEIRLYFDHPTDSPFIESINEKLNYQERFEVKFVEFRKNDLASLHLKSDRGQEYQLRAPTA